MSPPVELYKHATHEILRMQGGNSTKVQLELHHYRVLPQLSEGGQACQDDTQG